MMTARDRKALHAFCDRVGFLVVAHEALELRRAARASWADVPDDWSLVLQRRVIGLTRGRRAVHAKRAP